MQAPPDGNRARIAWPQEFEPKTYNAKGFSFERKAGKSSTCSKVITGKIGPNISSCIHLSVISTLSRIVGEINKLDLSYFPPNFIFL